MLDLFKLKKVDLRVDSLFGNYTEYTISKIPTVLEFRTIELVFLLGTFETSKYNPSLYSKLIDFNYLYDHIVPNSVNFMIDTNGIRQRFGSEKIKLISEHLGYAFGLKVLSSLLDTNPKSIKKITTAGAGRKPDYLGNSKHNDLLVLEGKGSTNINTIKRQIDYGKTQKVGFPNSRFGVVSAVHLNENQRSVLYIEDPPGTGGSLNSKEKSITRAEYYSRVFSLIGIKELSRYFSLMQRRLTEQSTHEFMSEKIDLLHKITHSYDKLEFEGQTFLGSYRMDDSGLICFTGVNKEAMYVNAFLRYESSDYEESIFFNDKGDSFYFPESKIVIAFLERPEKYIKDYIKKQKTIIGIDDLRYANEIVTIKLVTDILKSNGAIILSMEYEKHQKVDIVFSYNKKTYYVDVKKIFTSDDQKILNVFDSASKYAQDNNIKNFVLFTPSSITGIKRLLNKTIRIIDRNDIKELLKGTKALSNYLD